MGKLSDAAKAYVDMGIQPVLLKPKSKIPVHKNWQNTKYEPDADFESIFPDGHNIGANLGAASNNLIDLDLDSPELIAVAPYFLPETPARFGRPGKRNSHWLYFVEADHTIKRSVFTMPDGKELLGEIRATGNQTMMPPSVHAKWVKNKIEHINGEVTWELPGTIHRPTLIDYMALFQPFGLANATAMMGKLYRDWSGNGINHQVMLALSGSLIRNGIKRDMTERMCKLIFTIGGETDVADRLGAIQSTLDKWEADPSVELTGLPTLAGLIGDAATRQFVKYAQLKGTMRAYELTDDGNAARFADMYADRVRYNKNTGRWYVWDGTRWAEDITQSGDSVFYMARSIPHKIAEEAARCTDEKELKALSAWTLKSQEVSRLAAIPRIVRTYPEIAVPASAFDRDPGLFNVLNGTINLRTGGFEPHNPSSLISKQSPVIYDPNATCPAWLDYLEGVQPDEAHRLFLQSWIGYSMTGFTNEQVYVILHGVQGTGKTTFVETIKYLFGTYCVTAEPKTFMVKNFDSRASSDVARLAGARLVLASEAEQGQRFATAFVKRITGNTTLTAAALYQAEFEFAPQFKLLMDTNHMPRLPADDEAVWKRTLIIPWEKIFRDTPNQIKTLQDILRNESSGILNWMVEGAVRWHDEGLPRPKSIIAKREEQRAEMDTVAQFVNERCHKTDGARTAARALHAAYVEYCKLNQEPHFSTKRFYEHMRTLGFEDYSPGRVLHFKNIALWERKTSKPDDEPGGNQETGD